MGVPISLPPPPYVRAELYMGGMEKEWSNVFWWTVAAGVIDPAFDYGSAAEDCRSFLTSYQKDILSSANFIQGAAVTFAGSGGTYTVDVYQSVAGTVSGTEAPEDLAMVVQRLSFTNNKRGRGRFYLGGVPHSFSAGSYLSAAGHVALNLWATGMGAAATFGTLSVQPAVFSRKNLALYNVESMNAVSLLGTQRHRRTRF